MRALLVTSRWPWPPRRGNQVRIQQWIDGLGIASVRVLAPAGDHPPPAGASVASWRTGPADAATAVATAAVKGLPLQEGLYRSRSAHERLRRVLDEGGWDLAVVQMVRCGWALDAIAARPDGPPVVLDLVDSMAVHFERAAAAARGPFRWLAAAEAVRCARRERRLCALADRVVAVSEADLVGAGLPPGDGTVIPVAVPGPCELPPLAPEPVVVMTGNLGYRPTVAAATWFGRAVWPRVRRRRPDARWILAGSRPAAPIRRLARDDGVELRADPADLGATLGAARLALAPMTGGSGIPIKVLEAWAGGVPVVASPDAVAGLPAAAHACRVVPTTEPGGWVESVVHLLESDAESEALRRRGRTSWSERFTPERVNRQLVDTANAVAGGRPRRADRRIEIRNGGTP